MLTTNPDRSVIIKIITWHFQFHPVNVSIPHLKYECGARSDSHFACFSHCYDCYEMIYIHVIQLHGASVGPVSILTLSFPRMGIPMLKIRRTRDRLIFNMGIHMPVRHHDIDTDPQSLLRRAMRLTSQTIYEIQNWNLVKMVSALIVIALIQPGRDWWCVFSTAPLSCANCDPGITKFLF